MKLELACALWSRRRERARELVATAFEEARRRFRMKRDDDNVVHRVAKTLIETMIQTVRKTTSGRFFAEEFVTAVIQWVGQARDPEVGNELEALASEAPDESVKNLLLAGAATVNLQVGDGGNVLPFIRQLPSAALESVRFLDSLDLDRLARPLSRDILKELICRDISPSEFFGDVLTAVLNLSVLTMPPADAVLMLDSVEKSVPIAS
jgi:hypothetical protein